MTDWTAAGARVRQARAAAAWTQGELGARVGEDQAAVSNLENGRRRPDEATLARYADALGVSVAYLRYGVTTDGDAGPLRNAAYREGWEAAIQYAANELDALALRIRASTAPDGPAPEGTTAAANAPKPAKSQPVTPQQR